MRGFDWLKKYKSWKVHRLTKILSWNVTKLVLFSNIAHLAVHTLLPLVLQCLDLSRYDVILWTFQSTLIASRENFQIWDFLVKFYLKVNHLVCSFKWPWGWSEGVYVYTQSICVTTPIYIYMCVCVKQFSL